MIPFMATKYAKDIEKFAKWLAGDNTAEEKFPLTIQDGATPQFPKRPTLQELVEYIQAGPDFEGKELPGKEQVAREMERREAERKSRKALAKEM